MFPRRLHCRKPREVSILGRSTSHPMSYPQPFVKVCCPLLFPPCSAMTTLIRLIGLVKLPMVGGRATGGAGIPLVCRPLVPALFVALWRRGFYVTTGTKFGGEWLAYRGAPLQHHAQFIVSYWPRPHVSVSKGTSPSETDTCDRLPAHYLRKDVKLEGLRALDLVARVCLPSNCRHPIFRFPD